MSYWKNMVLPRLKKLLKKGPKSHAAAEACRSFDASKEAIAKEIDDKKEKLQPKVVAIYKSSTTEAQGLLKEPTEAEVSDYSEAVLNLLIELSNAECPGAESLSAAATKHGPTAMSAPILFLLSKMTVFVAKEEAPGAGTSGDIPEVTHEETTQTDEECKPEITKEAASNEVSAPSA